MTAWIWAIGISGVRAQSGPDIIWSTNAHFSGVADVTWTTMTNWSLSAALPTGSNCLQAVGYDRKTNALPGWDVGGYTNGVVVYH